MNHAATVYRITNQVNGKTYIGVTRFSLEKRWTEHVFWSRYRPRTTHLRSAIAKYGAEHFTVEPIASCSSIDAAKDAEKFLIRLLEPQYNQTNGGEITKGRRLSKDARRRISEANRRRRPTPEATAKNSAAAIERYRTNPAWRDSALAALARGRANANQEKRKAAARAATTTEEFRAKMRRVMRERCADPALRQVLAANFAKARAAKGPVSEESRRRMSLAARHRGDPAFSLRAKKLEGGR